MHKYRTLRDFKERTKVELFSEYCELEEKVFRLDKKSNTGEQVFDLKRFARMQKRTTKENK